MTVGSTLRAAWTTAWTAVPAWTASVLLAFLPAGSSSQVGFSQPDRAPVEGQILRTDTLCTDTFHTDTLCAGTFRTGPFRAAGVWDVEDTRKIEGTWAIDKKRSTAIDPWQDLTIEIEAGEERLDLRRLWTGNYGFVAVDSIDIPINGTSHPASLKGWPDNRHIGAFARPDAERLVSATWLDGGQTLRVSTRTEVSVSQGKAQVRTYSEYRPSPDGQELTVLELRSTRPRPIRYVLTRRAD